MGVRGLNACKSVGMTPTGSLRSPPPPAGGGIPISHLCPKKPDGASASAVAQRDFRNDLKSQARSLELVSMGDNDEPNHAA